MITVAAVVVVVALLLLAVLIKWKWTGAIYKTEECPPFTPVQLVHRLCPHNNVVQSFEVEQKDSLDEHLDVLTRKLAEKEGRLRISKSKIRETQHEIDNLHAIDQDVRVKYREIMESLRSDLQTNESDCKKLQEQIEWVSRRRAELRDEILTSERATRQAFEPLNRRILQEFDTQNVVGEVRIGQMRYGEAAAELASNLSELQRGRMPDRVIDKPQNQHSHVCLRHRKEPHLPTASSVKSLVIKSPPMSDEAVLSNIHPAFK